MAGWSGAAQYWAEPRASCSGGRYHQAAGDSVAARLHAERALECASEPRQPLALIAAHRALGQIDTVTSQYEDAAEHLQLSLELARRSEAPYEQALTMLELAELAACTGDSSEARRLLQEVREICERLGANRSLERVHELEKRLPRATSGNPAGLSVREVEVLRLVAQGLTNVEIGEQLYLSPRTVAQHLRSVYNKLGVNSRAAAVARLAEYEIT